MKKAYTKALCIDSLSKFFEVGTIYPLIKGAYNNGLHVVGATKDGDVIDLTCHAFIAPCGKMATIETADDQPHIVFIEL